MPIAEQVLAWVQRERQSRAVEAEMLEAWSSGFEGYIREREDEIRRIELCALATREAAMFFSLYGDGTPQ